MCGPLRPQGHASVNSREEYCVGLRVTAGFKELPVNQGTVKWFNTSKGYGFIVPEGGGEDLFVHFSNITGDGYRTLEDGQKVEFELGEGRNGPEAVNVKPM